MPKKHHADTFACSLQSAQLLLILPAYSTGNKKKLAQNGNNPYLMTVYCKCLQFIIHLLGGSWEKISFQIARTFREWDAERLSLFAGKADLYQNRFQQQCDSAKFNSLLLLQDLSCCCMFCGFFSALYLIQAAQYKYNCQNVSSLFSFPFSWRVNFCVTQKMNGALQSMNFGFNN